MNSKTCTKCSVEKSFDCFSKSKGGKFGLKSECKQCSSVRFRKFYENNKDDLILKTRNFRKSNPNYSKEYQRNYYIKNREKVIAKTLKYLKSLSKLTKSLKNKKYYCKHKTKILRSNREWRNKNLAKVNLYSSIRRTRKQLATPKWLTEKDFRDIYSYYFLASELNKVAPDKFCVDHIVPICGENVCGLHVPWNLQLLTISENCSKSNKFISED